MEKVTLSNSYTVLHELVVVLHLCAKSIIQEVVALFKIAKGW